MSADAPSLFDLGLVNEELADSFKMAATAHEKVSNLYTLISVDYHVS